MLLRQQQSEVGLCPTYSHFIMKLLYFFYGVCHGRSVRCSFNDIYTATPYSITLLASTDRWYANQLSILNRRHHLLCTSRHHVVSVVYGFIHELIHVLTAVPRRPLRCVHGRSETSAPVCFSFQYGVYPLRPGGVF